MNELEPFFTHESDYSIMINKDRTEISNWSNDLEYINEELAYLLEIEDQILNNTELYPQLHAIRRENQLRLAALYRYGHNIQKAVECDTTDCDAYYLNNHEKHRNVYEEHLEKYRKLKSILLSSITAQVKK